MDNVVVKVENVSKKFCSDLKKSLWYGVQDILGEMAGQNGARSDLRPQEFWSLKDVSFQLEAGKSLAILGPNGAGKSTFLKVLNGLIKLDEGRVDIQGRIGALIELGAGFNPILTGRENIYVYASILGISTREVDKRLDEIIEFAEISKFIDSPVQSYSSGMKSRLGFAVASHLNPDILLVDEVLAVGDVGFRMKCFRHLLDIMKQGTSLIIVSHNVNLLSRVTNRALVLNRGRLVFDGELSIAIGRYQLVVEKQKETARLVESGIARIDSVRLFDHHGEQKQEFLTGDTIHAEIVLITEKPVYGARIIASIDSPAAGILGTFSTPCQNFEFDIIPPKIIIRLSLPDIPLLVGGYSITLSLYGPKFTDFYDRIIGAANFQISGPPTNAFGFGFNDMLRFTHKWKQL
ncbi:MAG: ABC transporter ATP-binding protein [Moorea sp. SIO2B7]|nr:ABC transporter ATP-binding protein [Moorena sp. SIO2B7]